MGFKTTWLDMMRSDGPCVLSALAKSSWRRRPSSRAVSTNTAVRCTAHHSCHGNLAASPQTSGRRQSGTSMPPDTLPAGHISVVIDAPISCFDAAQLSWEGAPLHARTHTPRQGTSVSMTFPYASVWLEAA